MAPLGSGRRRGVRVLLLLLCAALDVVVLRRFVHREALAPGELYRGYFEEVEGRVTLVATEAAGDSIFPEMGHDWAGDVSVPPGNTAVLPLDPGRAYRVSSQTDLPPYVVLATRARRDHPGDRTARPLGSGQRLAARRDRLELVPWDATRPFHEDATWLWELATTCGDGHRTPALVVRRTGAGVELELGRCGGRLAPDLEAGHELALAVVAGPDWDLIKRMDRPFPLVLEVRWGPLVVALSLGFLGALLLYAGLGLPAALSVSLSTALASVWLPGPAVLCWVLEAPLGLLATAIRIGRRWPRRRLAVVCAAGAVVTGLLVLLVRRREGVVSLRPGDEGGPQTARCALTGYSAALGSGLRSQRGGTGDLLAEGCAACQGSVVVRARAGATFRLVRDLACDTPGLLPRGGKVAFLGGSNDDIFFWFDNGGALSMMTLRLYTFADDAYSREPSLVALRGLAERAAESSLRLVDLQARLWGEATRCARDAGDEVVLAHDFLVLDLASPRSLARAEMLARRRLAAGAAGAAFLDLSDIFAAQAGVSWFNDFIHPSAIGHRRIAAAICQRFQPAGSAP
jgi:hypothetical protein